MDETFLSDETNSDLDPYRLSKIVAEKVAWEAAESFKELGPLK